MSLRIIYVDEHESPKEGLALASFPGVLKSERERRRRILVAATACM